MTALIEIINCLLSGMCVGLKGFLAALPIYQALSDLKEQIIASALGVPVVVVSIALLVPTLIKLTIKIVKAF
ncbi:MAG: hypothetical protein J5666_05040 [Bacilli bacterium]|nr:hypothetical protein [Bacilli bacterium]